MYTGPEREVKMILPLGDEKYNYTYELLVKVEDKYQFATPVRLKVRVRMLFIVKKTQFVSEQHFLLGLSLGMTKWVAWDA